MGDVYRFDCGCQWPVIGPPPRKGALPLLAVDDEHLPFCRATWALLARGDTKGVFQLESSLGRTWTRKLRPESGHHIGALGALLRPGCLRAVLDEETGTTMTQQYCRVKNGEAEVRKYHPAIDPILAPTFGVLVFQEQSMEIAKAVAGFTLQEADYLRKACGKKLPEEMAKVKKLFIDGAARTGVMSPEKVAEVFGWIEKSQRYAFNASHAVSYGLTGYDTAYFKAHFPVAFYTAWLLYAKDKADPMREVNELVNDARLNDVEVLPPDLRNGEPYFSTDGVAVTFGLSDVRGVGEKGLDKVKAAVAQAEATLRLPLRDWSWVDFLLHASAGIVSSVADGLVKGGAVQWLGATRTRMLFELAKWRELTQGEREWVVRHDLAARGLLAAEDVVPPLPPEPSADEEKYRGMAAGDAGRLVRPRKKAWEKKALKREADVAALAGQRPFASLAGALRAAGRTKGQGGGCSNARRAEELQGLALFVEKNGAKPDRPGQVAADEKHYLGIALTCSEVDEFDPADVNCTLKEFAAGRTGYLVLGVKVEDVREVRTKRGNNPGQKMAFLTLSDSTCAFADVVCFSDAWKEYSHLLRTGCFAIVQGEKDARQGGLVVKRASEWRIATPPG